MDIFIVCTRAQGGRYVRTASTDESRARAEAVGIVSGFAADGWDVEAHEIERADGPGEPGIIAVWMLRNADNWGNVELYKVSEG